MSVEAMAKAFQRRGLTQTQKLVLLGIANHDGDGGAWPSVATLACYAEVSARSVQRALSELADLGLVTVERQAGGTRDTRNDRRPNRYLLHLDGVTPVTPRDERGDSGDADGVTLASQRGDTAMSPEPSLNHPKNHPTPPTPPQAGGGDATELFERFWKSYPRSVDRAATMRAFRKALKRLGGDIAPMSTGLRAWKAYWEARNEPAMIPYSARWLNGSYWESSPPAIVANDRQQQTRDTLKRVAGADFDGASAIRRIFDGQEAPS